MEMAQELQVANMGTKKKKSPRAATKNPIKANLLPAKFFSMKWKTLNWGQNQCRAMLEI